MSAVTSYITGLIGSFILTLIAFMLVLSEVQLHRYHLPNLMLIFIILFLAVVQLAVQVVFFVHLGHEAPPKWNSVLFISTFATIFLIVISSIWIMSHLNYNMTPEQMNQQYTQNQSGF